MAAITTLRSTLATAVTDNTKWQTFAYPPATIQNRSVIVSWDTPMLEMSNNQYNSVGPRANMKLLLTVPMFDNKGNLGSLETMIVDVFNLLSASDLHVTIESVSSPALLNLASGDLLTAEMSLSIITSWS